MKTIRHVGNFVKDKDFVFNRLAELEVDYDVVPVANLSFRDGIMYRPPHYNYGLTEDRTDHWLSMPSVMIPEMMMWCDCHKHRIKQNQVMRNYRDITKSELNSVWGGRTRLNVTEELLKNFPHHYNKSQNNVSGELCENYRTDINTGNEKTSTEKPNRWHLKAVFYDLDGGCYSQWFYPDDLIVRIPYGDYVHENCHLSTISDWISYGNMEGGGHNRDDFERELGENWTWDIDNPRKCFLDSCSEYKDIEDYQPNYEPIKSLAYQNTLENLTLQLKFARWYRVKKLGYEGDEEILQDSVFRANFGLDDDTQPSIYSELAFKSVMEMCIAVGIVKNMKSSITDDDVVTLILWFQDKINDINNAIKHNLPVSYLIENILERDIENKDFEELYT